MPRGRSAQVVAIGIGQMVAWASSVYLPAMLADAMAESHGLTAVWIFAAFSSALGVMALLGPWLGRLIDERGGRLVLASGSLPGIAMLFALLHGAGNGLITIAKGTLPLAVCGAQGYGELQGKLAVAQRIMQALAPFVFSLVLSSGGVDAALGLTLGFSLVALLALFALKAAADPG